MRTVVVKILMILLCLAAISFDSIAGTSAEEEDFLLGRKLYEDGFYDIAAEGLIAHFDRFPESPYRARALWLAGEAYEAQEDWDAARVVFQRYAIELSRDKRAFEAFLKTADAWQKLGESEQFARTLYQAIYLYPSNNKAPETLLRLARVYYNLGKWDDADDILARLTSQHPLDKTIPEAYLLWSLVLEKKGLLKEACLQAERAVKKADVDDLKAASLARLGVCLSNVKRWKEAEEVWKSLIADYPKSNHAIEAIKGLGNQYILTGRLMTAKRLYEKVLNENPGTDLSEVARLGLGDFFAAQSKYSEAESQYFKAGFGNPVGMFRRALLREKEGKLLEAVKLVEDLKLEDDNWAEIRFQQAQWYYQLGQYRNASELFIKLTTDPRATKLKEKACYWAAKALRKFDQEEALKHLKDVPGAYAGNSLLDEVIYLKASLHEHLGESGDAVKLYRLVTELTPFSSLTRAAKSKIKFLSKLPVSTYSREARLATLLSEAMSAKNDPDTKIAFAEFLCSGYAEYDRAARQLESALLTPKLSQAIKLKAEVLLEETLWNLYLDTKVELGTNHTDFLSQSRSIKTRMKTLRQGTNDKNLQTLVTYRIVLITLDQALEVDKDKTAVTAWQNFLKLYPDAEESKIARLYLAEALLNSFEQSEDSGAGIQARTVLDSLSSAVLSDTLRSMQEYLYGRLVQGDSSYADAEQHFKKSLQLKNGPYTLKTEFYRLRNPNLTTQERKEILNKLDEPLIYLHDNKEILEQLAFQLFGAGDFSLAEEKILDLMHKDEECGTVYPRSPYENATFFELLGTIYLEQGLPEKAINQYQNNLLFEMPDSQRVVLRYQLADVLLKLGKFEDAIDECELVLKKTDKSALSEAARRIKMQSQFELGRYDDAKKESDILVKSTANRDSAYSYTQFGIVTMYRRGMIKEAFQEAKNIRKTFKEYDDHDEATGRFLLEKGRYFSKKKNYKESERIFSTLMDKFGNTSWAPYGKYEQARDYLKQHQNADGIKLLNELLLETDNKKLVASALYLLGNYYLENGSPIDAEVQYRRVLNEYSMKPIWPGIYQNLILGFKREGHFPAAIRVIEEYIGRYPDADDTYSRRVELGTLYLGEKEYVKAIDHFRAIQPDADIENEIACQYYIGECFEKQQRWTQAIREYLKVKYLGKRTKLKWLVTALYNAGKCYEKLGKPVSAEKLYREIVSREGLGSPFGRKASEQAERLRKQHPESF